jgi:hypothetical protein
MSFIRRKSLETGLLGHPVHTCTQLGKLESCSNKKKHSIVDKLKVASTIGHQHKDLNTDNITAMQHKHIIIAILYSDTVRTGGTAVDREQDLLHWIDDYSRPSPHPCLRLIWMLRVFTIGLGWTSCVGSTLKYSRRTVEASC